MPFILYVIVLLLAAGSVLFGLDWMNAPLPSRPKPSPAIQASVSLGAHTRNASDTKAKDDALLNPLFPVSPKSDNKPDNETRAENAASTSTTTPPCDVNACASAYRSFRASDCTYMRYDGQRPLCKKGKVPVLNRNATVTAGHEALATADRERVSCNVSACERAYHSFNASDCTYQPLGGPRRICRK